MYRDNRIAVILVAAGLGKRLGGNIPKQYHKIGDEMILERTLGVFENHSLIDDIYLVVNKDYMKFCHETLGVEGRNLKLRGIISGGNKRQESVFYGLKTIEKAAKGEKDLEGTIPYPDYVLIHDGVRPFVSPYELDGLLEAAVEYGAASLAVPPKDSVVKAEGILIKENLDRGELYLIQTPQAFKFQMIIDAHRKAQVEKYTGTDDTVLVRRMGADVAIVEGSYANMKITTLEDISYARESLVKNRSRKTECIRIGNGFDVHAFKTDRDLVLGGVKIEWEQGLFGHSDADVLVHAIIDSLLGACGRGDIGTHFPDSQEAYKGVSSLDLLSQVKEMVDKEGFRIGNIDSTVIAQRPKILPYINQMRINIAKSLEVEKEKINIKATTTEGLGFCGRGEGMAAMASATIYKR